MNYTITTYFNGLYFLLEYFNVGKEKIRQSITQPDDIETES